jgi:putative OPT family oligopeptide transporter
MSEEAARSFSPHVPADESPPELTPRAILLGVILGIVFGAASTYLALRVGITTSASVPIAVVAIAVLKRRRDQRAILEHNITQTVGSAGESVAAAVVFTVPALVFLGYPLEVGLTTLIAVTGGVLGVLLMVPLRRYLIVKEHGVLRYPEGKACAEILVAGEKGGTSARKVFAGLAAGAAFKAVQALLGGVKASAGASLGFFKGTRLACDFEPPLLGVGYIIGYRTSVVMVSGSLLAAFVIVPLILLFGAGSPPVPPAAEAIRDMTADDVWGKYVKHIGAGAVAAGGIFGLLRALPTILSSLAASVRSLGAAFGGAAGASGARTERDTPLGLLLAGAVGIAAFIWLFPAFEMNLAGAAMVLAFAFIFGVVSSRITGEVGSTSCPLSGMTIGVLMATCGVFLAAGWEGSAYSRLALMIGAVVCVAISNAGTCSQDLKTGYLVGATPVRQQGALLIGVLSSVLAVGWTAYLLNEAETREEAVAAPFTVAPEAIGRAEEIAARTDGKSYRFVRLGPGDVPQGVEPGNFLVDPATGEARWRRSDGIGSGRLQAPQAKLMSVVIDGLLTRSLPWDLIFLGAAIAIFIELLGFPSLTFSVGVYLPLSSTMPVFLGGLVRRIADRRYGRALDAEDEPEGVLYSSGVIAGASILAILAAALAFDTGRYDPDAGLHRTVAVLGWVPAWLDEKLGGITGPVSVMPSDILTFGALALLGCLIYRAAAAKK